MISFLSSAFPVRPESLPLICYLCMNGTGARRACATASVALAPELSVTMIMSSRMNVILMLIIFSNFLSALSDSDGDILRRFKESLDKADALSDWDDVAIPPCNGDREVWKGVLCGNNSVWGLKLENMGLGGEIDFDALAELKHLRSISFKNNNFEGPFPVVAKLGSLKSLHLSNNRFSGEIPSATFAMLSLKKISLANNQFTGLVPVSLATLPRLVELTLENNGFEGTVPAFRPGGLRVFNISNNRLGGKIPDSLSHIPASAFSGNEDLCGPPLANPCSPDHRPISIATLVIVHLVVGMAVAALIAVVFILARRKQISNQPKRNVSPADLEKLQVESPTQAADHYEQAMKADQRTVRLTFLREDREKFDMSHLLKASAEILGSGVFGSTYKACLTYDQEIVVKRYKHMNNVNREEFNEHMQKLGKLNHPNLLSIVAFYYRKEEKLMVTDFVQNVSLAVHLHAKSSNYSAPDWPTRLMIVKGIAKGLQYLNEALPSITAPHGHLKSSNVLLDRFYNPVLADYGLVPIVNQEEAHVHMIAYKSPEYKYSKRITKKTDVWSFGVLILEILTGRFPSNFLQQGTGSDVDLTTWAKSMLHDESHAGEVFDKEMKGTENCEGEMMKLLKIGLSCCQAEVDSRPDINEAGEKIEAIKEKD